MFIQNRYIHLVHQGVNRIIQVRIAAHLAVHRVVHLAPHRVAAAVALVAGAAHREAGDKL
ncbi:hypothetical protein AB6G19_08680 [Providencia manganoxydans]